MSNNAKTFPKPKFAQLKDESNYSCQGSCTCNYLKDRTGFDNEQKSLYSFENGAVPRQALNQYFGQMKPYLIGNDKVLSKYIGI